MSSHNIILSYVLDKLSNGYSIEQIKSSDDFNTLCENNPINIGDAQRLENNLRTRGKLPRLAPYCVNGCYWLQAYNNPKNGDNIIFNNRYIGRARNVGLFTFHIVNEERDDSLIDEVIEKNNKCIEEV